MRRAEGCIEPLLIYHSHRRVDSGVEWSRLGGVWFLFVALRCVAVLPLRRSCECQSHCVCGGNFASLAKEAAVSTRRRDVRCTRLRRILQQGCGRRSLNHAATSHATLVFAQDPRASERATVFFGASLPKRRRDPIDAERSCESLFAQRRRRLQIRQDNGSLAPVAASLSL